MRSATLFDGSLPLARFWDKQDRDLTESFAESIQVAGLDIAGAETSIEASKLSGLGYCFTSPIRPFSLLEKTPTWEEFAATGNVGDGRRY